MNVKGKFDLPVKTRQGTAGARRAYLETFGREWPYADGHLRVLAREVPKPSSYLWKPGQFTRCEMLLWGMRECHEFRT